MRFPQIHRIREVVTPRAREPLEQNRGFLSFLDPQNDRHLGRIPTLPQHQTDHRSIDVLGRKPTERLDLLFGPYSEWPETQSQFLPSRLLSPQRIRPHVDQNTHTSRHHIETDRASCLPRMGNRQRLSLRICDGWSGSCFGTDDRYVINGGFGHGLWGIRPRPEPCDTYSDDSQHDARAADDHRQWRATPGPLFLLSRRLWGAAATLRFPGRRRGGRVLKYREPSAPHLGGIGSRWHRSGFSSDLGRLVDFLSATGRTRVRFIGDPTC